MHTKSLEQWSHDHIFGQDRPKRGERLTLIVIVLTAVTMVVEIVAGLIFGSRALVHTENLIRADSRAIRSLQLRAEAVLVKNNRSLGRAGSGQISSWAQKPADKNDCGLKNTHSVVSMLC
jgi:hypothetical protein